MAAPDRARHPDVAALAVGGLDDGDARRVRTEIESAPEAAAQLAELRALDALLRTMAPAGEPSSDVRARTHAAIAAEAEEAGATAAGDGARSRRRRPRLALAGAGAALAVVVAAVVLALGAGDGASPGELEIEATLRGSDDPSLVASADVFRQGFGRTIELSSENLPVLPTGEFYELWFVGPGDGPGAPNRISAGTWHPDEEGLTQVAFHAAVDPALFGVIEVTREPADGDPAPSEPVLRWRAPTT